MFIYLTLVIVMRVRGLHLLAHPTIFFFFFPFFSFLGGMGEGFLLYVYVFWDEVEERDGGVCWWMCIACYIVGVYNSKFERFPLFHYGMYL